MKKAMNHELTKLIDARLFYISLLLGCGISVIHFVYTVMYVNWAYYSVVSDIHPRGLDNISLLYCWIGNDDFSLAGIMFFLVLPILACMPYSSSLYKEMKNGYKNQVMSRIGRRRYLLSKLIVIFISGFITIMIPVVLNLMLCALVCPLSNVHVLSFQTSMWQGSFFVRWFYMHPILFLAASVLLSSIWGGVCAIMGGMAGVLFKNQVLIIIAPFLILSMISFVTGYGKGVLFETSYELGPLYLFRPACWDRNPAWYIAIWQVAFSGISALIFFWRGKKSELS